MLLCSTLHAQVGPPSQYFTAATGTGTGSAVLALDTTMGTATFSGYFGPLGVSAVLRISPFRREYSVLYAQGQNQCFAPGVCSWELLLSGVDGYWIAGMTDSNGDVSWTIPAWWAFNLIQRPVGPSPFEELNPYQGVLCQVIYSGPQVSVSPGVYLEVW
jgi:hypothetical protein